MANLEQLKFAKSHEWVADNGDGTFSIGLTDSVRSVVWWQKSMKNCWMRRS